jgi:hypothetical protein
MDASFIQKGGEQLTQHAAAVVPSEASSGATVELRQGGGVKIQTPASTNAPPK